MARRYRVTVYDSRISSIIKVGDGNDWLKRQATKVENMARIIAPRSSGRLAASHRTTQNRDERGRYRTGFTVSADVPYARFVHEGTGIYGPLGRPVHTGRWMRIPGVNPNPNRRQGTTGTVVMSHRGQKPQPWLELAANIVL